MWSIDFGEFEVLTDTLCCHDKLASLLVLLIYQSLGDTTFGELGAQLLLTPLHSKRDESFAIGSGGHLRVRTDCTPRALLTA